MFHAFALICCRSRGENACYIFPLSSTKRCSFSVRYTVKAARTSCHTRPHFGRFAVHENNLLIARRETRAHTSGLQTSNSPSRGLKSCGLSGSYAELFVSRVLRAASPVVSFHSLLRNYFAVARRRGRRLRPAARYTFPCRSCGVHGFLRQDVA